MNKRFRPLTPGLITTAILGSAACLLPILSAHASENYRMRQSPVGLLGGEIAAAVEQPGFFGTAALTYIHIHKVVDDKGDDISLPARTIPLATGTPSGGLVPNGTYTLSMPAGTVEFDQKQTQLNLVAGYVTTSTWNGWRTAFLVNLPMIQQKRQFLAAQGAGTVSPTPPAGPVSTVVGGVTAATRAQVQAGIDSRNAANNQDVSGLGDAELSAVWLRNIDGLKLAAGASLFVPTGQYDKDRGPNPGFGDFYTLRPGVALTYALSPSAGSDSWDRGVTLAGRLAYGINTTNKDTEYRSGNFVYAEAAVVKVSGDWGWGANLSLTQQVTDDRENGIAKVNSRYKNNAIGPFISYKLPGQSGGVNLHYSSNFGSRNAVVTRALQLRFIQAW